MIKPLWIQTLKGFRQCYRALFCLRLLAGIIGISVCAPLLCNDQPLFIYSEKKFFSPVFRSYCEVDLGYGYEVLPDYRSKAFSDQMKQKNATVIWPLIRYGPGTVNMDLKSPPPNPPDSENFLGTDDQGRDVCARLIYSIRTTLLFSLILAISSAGLGILVGAISGYYGGWVDLLFQRLVEIWSAIPILFVLMIFSRALYSSIGFLLFLMIILHWPQLVGITRAEFLRVRAQTYIKAAQTMGLNKKEIIFKHIMPNALRPIIGVLPFMVGSAMTLLTSLDFMGFGLFSDSPCLGELLKQAHSNLHRPSLAIIGLISFTGIMLLIIFIGEGLRNALDPRKVLCQQIDSR